MLLYLQFVNKHEILLLSSKFIFCCLCRYMVKLCHIYMLHKNSSTRNIMKQNYHSNKFTSWLGLQNFLMELYQVYQKSNIFVERIYRLKNFDMNSKGCHLGCQFRTHTRKLIASQLQENEIFGIKLGMCECSQLASRQAK